MQKFKDGNLRINILYFGHECLQAIHPILVGFLNRWIAINPDPVNHKSFLTVKMSKKHLQTITKIDRENSNNDLQREDSCGDDLVKDI